MHPKTAVLTKNICSIITYCWISCQFHIIDKVKIFSGRKQQSFSLQIKIFFAKTYWKLFSTVILCVLVCFHTIRMAVTAVHFWHGVFVNSGESLQKINGRAPKVYAACIMLLISQAKGWRKENMFTQINNFITWFDGVVILRMVWENSGDGLQRFLHSSEPGSVFSELVPLLR